MLQVRWKLSNASNKRKTLATDFKPQLKRPNAEGEAVDVVRPQAGMHFPAGAPQPAASSSNFTGAAVSPARPATHACAGPDLLSGFGEGLDDAFDLQSILCGDVGPTSPRAALAPPAPWGVPAAEAAAMGSPYLSAAPAPRSPPLASLHRSESNASFAAAGTSGHGAASPPAPPPAALSTASIARASEALPAKLPDATAEPDDPLSTCLSMLPSADPAPAGWGAPSAPPIVITPIVIDDSELACDASGDIFQEAELALGLSHAAFDAENTELLLDLDSLSPPASAGASPPHNRLAAAAPAAAAAEAGPSSRTAAGARKASRPGRPSAKRPLEGARPLGRPPKSSSGSARSASAKLPASKPASPEVAAEAEAAEANAPLLTFSFELGGAPKPRKARGGKPRPSKAKADASDEKPPSPPPIGTTSTVAHVTPRAKSSAAPPEGAGEPGPHFTFADHLVPLTPAAPPPRLTPQSEADGALTVAAAAALEQVMQAQAQAAQAAGQRGSLVPPPARRAFSWNELRPKGKSAKGATQLEAYFAEHQIQAKLHEYLNDLAQVRPSGPYDWLARRMRADDLGHTPAVGTVPLLTSTGASAAFSGIEQAWGYVMAFEQPLKPAGGAAAAKPKPANAKPANASATPPPGDGGVVLSIDQLGDAAHLTIREAGAG